MTQVQYIMDSMIGPIHLVADDQALVGIFWKKQKVPLVKTLSGNQKAIAILLKTEKQLNEYFKGKRKKFDLPLAAEGTAFQKSVWNQLSQIPYGVTCSYSDIAKLIKSGKAVRAVGTANGRNPYSIVVPCHRVIHASGGMGGYAGGLPIKNKLLDLEKKNL